MRSDDLMLGAGLLAGSANVIMQLGHPAVGYGVYESRVENGRLFDHPVKRTRTTLTYLAVATMGSEEERKAYRRAVGKQHAQVRSTGSSPVKYNALDPGLQLWVAACLYRGVEDIYRVFAGGIDPEIAEEVYQACSRLGTTLQVREDMWPADREAFEKYWTNALDEVVIDDTIRAHLMDITTMKFLPRPVSTAMGGFNTFVTTGFLPERFREEMKLPWSAQKQRSFDRLMRRIGAVTLRSPRVLREFPYNAYMWDLRRRIASGRPLV
ncbi:DUF2236 domain-containing protein [Amycolatopsis acidicola]|uniref:DUF2236 domain-containing protein n=1 Tax=Amycolatopsis acidicola TaxID=2596893 RepID=A0A5N0UQG7_9PSEU|nr:oxygenase MpaB family protein [Amycolatopsis acidicola]KAA9151169.1 DUF2236 domain-containing protein [Amycolatopsis acidicola]